MAKVVLVNPKAKSQKWGTGRHPRCMDDLLPRHGLTYLSASLKRAGHQVILADLRQLAGWEEYERLLLATRPDFVCSTAHTLEVEIACESLVRAKRTLPTCTTVGGGIHLTMDPSPAMETGHVDNVIRGEGEVSLPCLVEEPTAFSPVSWGEPPDLDELPFEDRELYPDYLSRTRFPLWDLPTPIVDVLTGRGCPWNCRFCCGPGEKQLFTKPSAKDPSKRRPFLRRRSVDHVMAELDQLHRRYHFRSVVFHDDQFLIRPQWVLDFCEKLHRAGYPRRGVRWWAASRADMVCRYPNVFKSMRDAGLQIISIGFESFSEPVLKWLNKGVSVESNFRAAEICHKLGLQIYANVIFGVPRADGRWYLADDLASFNGLRVVRPRYLSPSLLTPIPGSWLFDWSTRLDLLREDAPNATGSRNPGNHPLKGVDYKKLERLLRICRREHQGPWRDRWRYYRHRFSAILEKAVGSKDNK